MLEHFEYGVLILGVAVSCNIIYQWLLERSQKIKKEQEEALRVLEMPARRISIVINRAQSRNKKFPSRKLRLIKKKQVYET